ncbi:hypothetical protein [Terriglobus tenax]|uniref:hypothetical protein n=1 Tax=Terriglobus tenax TaxID=1111115 RepID=UPI0021E01D0E|nr:hypothetical protein [Terriglobus tenax]
MKRKLYVFAALTAVALVLSACGVRYYKFPQYTYAGRPIPPSKFAYRVLASYSSTISGGLQILDAQRDLRNNIFDANSTYSIQGYSGTSPSPILNLPEQVTGFVYSQGDGSLAAINYGTEQSSGAAATLSNLSSVPDGIKVSTDLSTVYSAQEAAGQLQMVIRGSTQTSYSFNLPNVNRVFVNQGNTVVLATRRNSDSIYRLVKLNSNQAAPPGAVDCQPYQLPAYCIVQVSGSFDRPTGVYFSNDGSQGYVLNCGAECGGTTASVSFLNLSNLTIYNIPTVTPEPNYVAQTVPVPGGVTAALVGGSTLYLSGQQLLSDGYWTGNLSTIDLTTKTVTGKYSISDGSHTKMLFGDDNTLWIGSQKCATGERAYQSSLGNATQAANYNCLTRFDRSANTVQIVPSVNKNAGTTVKYPNQDYNQYYYGDLTGLCWVQSLHKMYTAYGGQIHAFNTADGSEINNSQITIQGTVLDVAFMDALTNFDN